MCFLNRSTFTPRDNRASMPHTFFWRCSNTGDIRNNRLCHMIFYILCSHFFCVTADLTHHNDCGSRKVVFFDNIANIGNGFNF